MGVPTHLQRTAYAPNKELWTRLTRCLHCRQSREALNLTMTCWCLSGRFRNNRACGSGAARHDKHDYGLLLNIFVEQHKTPRDDTHTKSLKKMFAGARGGDATALRVVCCQHPTLGPRVRVKTARACLTSHYCGLGAGAAHAARAASTLSAEPVAVQRGGLTVLAGYDVG